MKEKLVYQNLGIDRDLKACLAQVVFVAIVAGLLLGGCKILAHLYF